MAYRWHGRAEVNPDWPRAWATCDGCGFNFNLYKLQWQRQWAGFQLINQRTLVCETCLDKPAAFLKAIVLPPDPPPLVVVRPEPYRVDEEGPTQPLIAELELATSSITSLYLDLYDGDPTDGGSSVLETLTGSATRTDFAASMGAPVALIAINESTITLVSIAETSAEFTWLAAFDAASGGNLLASSAVIAQTVVMGNGLACAVGALTVRVTP
jgi:hypothetical protein